MLSDRELEQTYAKIKIKEKPFSNLLDSGTDSDPTDRWDGLGSVGEPHGVSVTAVQSDDLTAASNHFTGPSRDGLGSAREADCSIRVTVRASQSHCSTVGLRT